MLKVGIVVPTRNSARTLDACLTSIRDQTFLNTTSLVVDNSSTDDTNSIACRLADRVVTRGPERSAQRNFGASLLDVDIVGFIDSDMILDSVVIAEAVELIEGGAGAVIVSERTFGSGFWVRVRAYERTFYSGDDDIEAARFFNKELFDTIGGYDETMTGPEDRDITIRARRVAPIARTHAGIGHDESRMGYMDLCKRKQYYAGGLVVFARKHGSTQALRIVRRSYLRRPWGLFRAPLLGLGVVALKVGEGVAVAYSVLSKRYQ